MMELGSDTAELRGGIRGEELTLTGGSRCQPDEERDKAVGWAAAEFGNCRKGKGRKGKPSGSGKFSFLFLILCFSAFLFCNFNSN